MPTVSSDLTFITNESGKSLCDRFGVLLGDDTRLSPAWKSGREITVYKHLKP